MAGLRQLSRQCGRLRSARRFWADERGSILLYFTIVMVVIFGFVGLAVDGSRFFMLNNKLQDLADASALAGAKELNSEPGAICRARDAAMNLSNDPQWSNVATNDTVQIGEPAFFGPGIDDALPAPTCASSTTTDANDSIAAFIKVTTLTRQVAPTILVAVGAISPQSTAATATAGTTFVACNVQPLMLCNPFEKADGTGPEFQTAVSNGTVKPGMMFHMKVLNDPGSGGGNQSYAPGDFGLLDPPGLNSSGANTIRDLLSQQNPPFCYVNNVSPRTGQAVQKVNDGINVRFDVPVNGNTNNDPNLDLTPAPDVLKGWTLDNSYCNNGHKTDLGAAYRYPRDTSFTNYGNMQLGNGVLDPTAAATYMTNHFGSGATWPSGITPVQANRYLAYQAELNMTVAAGTEAKGPTCQAVNAESTADRRIISVAVVDCLANNVHGNAVTNVRSSAYADFFVTEPSTQGDLWAEFVRLMTPNSDGSKLHQIVQLYR
jgi:Flp pilus assembly protein TadG